MEGMGAYGQSAIFPEFPEAATQPGKPANKTPARQRQAPWHQPDRLKC